MKTKTKASIVYLLVILIVCTLLSSCANNKKDLDKTVNSNLDESFNDIKKNGKIVAGANLLNEPFVFKDSFTEEIKGINVDIMKKVCEKLGVELEIVSILPEEIESSLKNKDINMILNPVELTEDNYAKFEYSKPYLNNNLTLFTRILSPITKISDINDETIGVKKLSAAETYLDLKPNIKKNLKNVMSYESNQLLFASLAKKSNIDTVLTDLITGKYYFIKNNENEFVKTIVTKTYNSYYCFYYDKSSLALSQSIDACIDELYQEKELKLISEKWLLGNYLTRKIEKPTLQELIHAYSTRYLDE